MIRNFQKCFFPFFRDIFLVLGPYKLRSIVSFLSFSHKLREYSIKNTCSGCGLLFESTHSKYYLQNGLDEKESSLSPKNLRKQEEDRVFNDAMANLNETLRLQLLEIVSEKHLSMSFQKKKTQKRVLCRRCHGLIHHSMLSTEFLTHSETLSSASWVPRLLKEKNALLIHVIDSVDFPHSYVPELHNLFGEVARIFYVINKIDIISGKGSALEKIRNYFLLEISKLTHNVKEKILPFVILTSAVKGWGIDQLITSINKYKAKKSNIYFVGMTNVGKSSIVSKFAYRVGYQETPTVSFLPGTTLNPINIDINKLGNLFENSGVIIDAPGISSPERQLYKYVDYNNLKAYVPKKKFPRIRSFTMKAGNI
ncbi:hypothetical protein PMAC_000528 [Pneumocystis sp. 'macacae']|nr:hypothetical protein PMAC_000528 [Pneumocystis sp. 'macacae']